MKVRVQIRKGVFVTHEFEGYIVTAKPNEYGDLIVWRDHSNMITPQCMASYAAGQWLTHDIIWEEQDGT